MSDKAAERVNRIVERLLKGGRVSAGAGDAAEREAIRAAALLSGARESFPRPTPAFKRELAATLDAQGRPGWVSRRTAMVAGLGLALGGAAGVAYRARSESPAGPVPPVQPEPGRWVDVAALSEVPVGRALLVKAGAVEAFVSRSGDTLIAVSAICSHMPCHLDAQSDGTLLCPCHNKLFDASGKVLDWAYAAAVPPLRKVRVRVLNSRVEVLGT